nr:hypothetical protein [Tanacetum cinerariifolium]
MPIISNEPPDPLFDELCNLTKVTSAEDLCATSFNDTKVKVMKVKSEDSPGDNRGGKRVVSTPMDDEINKVLSNVRSGMFNTNLNFSLGCPDSNMPGCTFNNVYDVNELSNDGSFIKSPLDNYGLNDLGSPVAKSCGLQTSFDHTGMGDV